MCRIWDFRFGISDLWLSGREDGQDTHYGPCGDRLSNPDLKAEIPNLKS